MSKVDSVLTLRLRNLFKIIPHLCVTTVVSPAGSCALNLLISDICVCAVFYEELNHRSMAINRGIVQARTRIVKTWRDGIDLRTFLQQQLCCIDAVVHASIDECVVDDVLRFVGPRVNLRLQLLLDLSW
jgi:hypothetical protein